MTEPTGARSETLEAVERQLSDHLEGVEWNGPQDSFYEHAVKATSQYDAQYRAMAAEILSSRAAIRKVHALLQTPAALASRAAAPQERDAFLLRQAQPHICSLLCPSTRKGYEPWVHHALCEALQERTRPSDV